MNFKSLLLIAALIHSTSIAFANTDRDAIESTLQAYIEGSSYNQPDKLAEAFYEEANLFLSHDNKPIWQVPLAEYKTWFEPKGQFNGRVGEILSVDIENDIATAKVEILHPSKQIRYVDLLLLKNINDRWQIISKSATSEVAINNAKRILFIVSNAHFHGDSNLPAGVSFGEIVKAYETFKNAGYTVDFVSPEGGAIPLSYISTSTPIHKKYLYDNDFMYAIGNTKVPAQIQPSLYKAVHYIGGTNAMYGVAENKAIQKITMEIYEKHNGLISSVCHGTAGIVNLKTENGEYLVNNRRISGYPESFENQSKAYFQEFPFLIQQTVEQRGGKFFHSKPNSPHVEVDGRIITGQNHLSSALVAEKMIEILAKDN